MKACGALHESVEDHRSMAVTLCVCARERNITGGIAPSLARARHFFSRLVRVCYVTDGLFFHKFPVLAILESFLKRLLNVCEVREREREKRPVDRIRFVRAPRPMV